jgi:TIR domain
MTTRRLIFLSYARKDGAARAQRLVADLEAEGYEVWLDRQRIEGGSSWSREIETAIERCAAMVAVLSEGSFALIP